MHEAPSATIPIRTAWFDRLRAWEVCSEARRSSRASSAASPLRIWPIRVSPSDEAAGERAALGLSSAIEISGSPYSVT